LLAVAQYNIGRKQETCVSCGKEFADGEEVISCVFREGDGIGRADLCTTCWAEGGAPEHFSSWRRKVEKEAAPRRFDGRAALELFRVLVDSEEQQDADTAYILALLLMRKKIFELVRAGSEEGVKTMVLKLRSGAEEFRVVDRSLTEDRLEEVKNRLESIFEGGNAASEIPGSD
jgi:hypothetical protein